MTELSNEVVEMKKKFNTSKNIDIFRYIDIACNIYISKYLDIGNNWQCPANCFQQANMPRQFSRSLLLNLHMHIFPDEYGNSRFSVFKLCRKFVKYTNFFSDRGSRRLNIFHCHLSFLKHTLLTMHIQK